MDIDTLPPAARNCNFKSSIKAVSALDVEQMETKTAESIEKVMTRTRPRFADLQKTNTVLCRVYECHDTSKPKYGAKILYRCKIARIKALRLSIDLLNALARTITVIPPVSRLYSQLFFFKTC